MRGMSVAGSQRLMVKPGGGSRCGGGAGVVGVAFLPPSPFPFPPPTLFPELVGCVCGGCGAAILVV